MSETDNSRLKNWAQRNRRLLMIAGPAVLVVVGLFLYLTGGRYISTDDAYIQAGRAAISTNVPGRVVEIDVKDNQVVHKGQVLFKLDPRPFKIAVDDATAKLAGAKLQINALKDEYQQRLADLKAAQDTLGYQQRELERQKKLAGSGIASQAQLDQANHTVQNAQQQGEAMQQQVNTVLAQLGGDPNIEIVQHPTVEEAQAELDRALLNQSYATVVAPMDGVVTKVEQLQPGDYLNAAMTTFLLVSDTNIYIEANFKETDLTYMRPGQQATFKIDAFSGRTFTGTVASTSPGTGSSFSLLPPENASGNWVKVVQRVPVRIAIDKSDKDIPLNAGLSVDVTVDTQHRRALF
jgi:membrane fusion protein (multidrug efflux system)